MKEVFLQVLIASSFFFKLFPTCRLCWHCIPILVKLSTRYGRQHQAYFIIKRLVIKTLFIIDKESYYRSRHVLLDAVYILIYWWNMCHCHLKNQHQFIINLLWKTFESWKINCKKEKKKKAVLCHVIICNSNSWCGPFKRVMLFSFVSPCYCCGQIPEIWELDHPVGGLLVTHMNVKFIWVCVIWDSLEGSYPSWWLECNPFSCLIIIEL